MNLETYKELKKKRSKEELQYRDVCQACLQPPVICYCKQIEKINLNLKFIILHHPIEARRKAATGRMSHLCLPNSHLIRGHDFSKNQNLNDLLQDTSLYPVVLYPGPHSRNITHMTSIERKSICPADKTLAVLVLDGTWATAKKMIKHSRNLRDLPRICFTPDKPSNFRVRLQPHEGCYSTIEAIHHTIDLLGDSFGFDTSTREHDKLLKVFNSMVEVHLDFIEKTKARSEPSRYVLSRSFESIK